MRLGHFIGFAVLGLLAFSAVGCGGAEDPVAAGARNVTVAPEATLSPVEMARAQAERERKQAQIDRKAGRGGRRSGTRPPLRRTG